MYGGCWFGCFFFTACPRAVTLTALQTPSVFLSVFTASVLVLRCRQHFRQQLLCSQSPRVAYLRGKGGDSDAAVEWIPAAMLVQFAH